MKTSNPVIAMMADVEMIEAADGAMPSTPKKFAVKAYNGGALTVSRWDTPVVVDLAGMKSAKSVVANLYHDSQRLVGHATEITNDGAKLSISGVISATGQDAIEFAANAANGFPWQASIEAQPTQEPDFFGTGEKVTVNGQTFTGPVQVVRKSKLYGIAFVPRGADENTNVKIAAEAAYTTERDRMKPELKTWIEAQGFDPATLNDKQVESLGRQMAVEAAAATSGKTPPVIAAGNDGASLMGDDHWDLSTILAAHQDNLEAVDAIIAKHEDDVPDRTKVRSIRAAARDTIVGLKKKAITEKWSAERYELESVKAANAIEIELIHAERPTGPAIHSSSSRDFNPLVVEAALCQTLGLSNIEAHYKPEILEAAHKEFRGRMGLKQMLILAANKNGMHSHSGQSVDMGNIREVLHFATMKPVHAAGFSTMSLSGILSNVANKELLSGYQEADQSWREISMVKTVNDFKTVTSYRLLDSMEYDELAPTGRIQHGTTGEESYTRQAHTYAKMAALTRQDIINDDLSAFDDLRIRLGAGAAKKFNNLFWATFLDNSTFFTSGRVNYITGAATNLGNDGLEAGVTAFRKLRSPTADEKKRVGGALVGGRPEILLVPPELEFIADRLFKLTNLDSSATLANSNIHAGKYRPIVCDWLSDSAFTGYSATAWYLFRAPTMMAPMVVSFLNGVQNPTVESADADFDQLGIQFRGYHDFGVDKAEYLAGIKSKGAA